MGDGARVYSANCARCHNARSSMERTDAEWAVIVSHMRVRANLTKTQARAVLAYLQATNLPGTLSGDVVGSVAGADAVAGAVRRLAVVAELRRSRRW